MLDKDEDFPVEPLEERERIRPSRLLDEPSRSQES
jgi:hypothetical protein